MPRTQLHRSELEKRIKSLEAEVAKLRKAGTDKHEFQSEHHDFVETFTKLMLIAKLIRELNPKMIHHHKPTADAIIESLRHASSVANDQIRQTWQSYW